MLHQIISIFLKVPFHWDDLLGFVFQIVGVLENQIILCTSNTVERVSYGSFLRSTLKYIFHVFHIVYLSKDIKCVCLFSDAFSPNLFL